MLVLMLKTKMGPFLSMLLAALLIAMGCGMPAADAISTVTEGFGSTCKSLGIVIIFGTILGSYLEKANATQRIATTMLNTVGEDKADAALSATGFIVSIPVFSDVALIMLSPLAKALARKTKFHVGVLATVMALSLLMTNAFVAPTPAPLATAELINLDVGVSIFWGLIAALVSTVAAFLYCRFFLHRKPDSWWKYSEDAKEMNVPEVTEEEMPKFSASVLPILVPIVLILLSTTCKMVLPETSAILPVVTFFGDKNIALALGIVTCAILLGKNLGNSEMSKVISDSLQAAGTVIFITAAGGALAQVVKATTIGDTLANGLAASGLPIVLIPFLIAGFSKFAQGAGSVASLLAAGLTAPLIQAGMISAPVAFVSICAGTSFLSHVNNSFFWVFANTFGFDTETSMKSLALGQSVVAIAGLIVAVIMSFFM